MEAITIAGLTVLAAGGYYSFMDILDDLGFNKRTAHAKIKNLQVSRSYIVASKTRIKKMAGMNI